VARQAYRLWVKVFALSFALGVVSGITMSFQFGTNWPGFMRKAGNIAGPLLGYEVLTAFFLEATFLGVMLFGRDRVTGVGAYGVGIPGGDRHLASAFWILALNSWMPDAPGIQNHRWATARGRLVGRSSSTRVFRTGWCT